jgi:molybdopterin-guanine dinucleotide biosynthesis protein A
MTHDLSALILAGGKSSRMGRDKALIEIDGIPLLKRVCDAARQCTNSIYVMTSWVDRYQALLPSVNFIVEESPRSPIVAFAEALDHIPTEWVLLLACDLPRINGNVLQQWSTQLDQIPETVMALLPKHPKGWEPLCGFYRKTCLPGLQRHLEQGERSFQGWLEMELVQELRVSDRQILTNCNTPEDLSYILNQL